MGNRGNFALIFSQRTRTEERGNAITVLGKKGDRRGKEGISNCSGVPMFRLFYS
ncbi:hypothetical protein M595_3051 [Lyngbya aestuarii BL J]|uniref:Uncharacterized protein n=1 Tax=Lyngbya aestuarii BL J TaxID=1348334 RepID=U7QGA5_9CYAN|nr:hypothetical protein M595_3051 [Lyngbya aestuarii BL J]